VAGGLDPAGAPLGVQQPYALHVGDLHVRRNLSTALTAIIAVRKRLASEEPPPKLPAFVCAGVDRSVGAELRAQAARERDPGALVLTGPVSETALVNLYRGATMLLYPSRYEGFGLPVLEAMQCGTPVIGAKAASIPELVGDAGLLVDPLRPELWADAIHHVISDSLEATWLSGAGRRRATMFTWTRTAEETLESLRRCARLRRGRHEDMRGAADPGGGHARER